MDKRDERDIDFVISRVDWMKERILELEGDLEDSQSELTATKLLLDEKIDDISDLKRENTGLINDISILEEREKELLDKLDDALSKISWEPE